MSVKKITAIVVVFAVTSIAWMILGASTSSRTGSSFSSLKQEVASLYGSELIIRTPECYTKTVRIQEEIVDGKRVERKIEEKKAFDLAGSDIDMDILKDRRKKGNLWFPTFKARFSGKYSFDVSSIKPGQEVFLFTSLYSSSSIYDSIGIRINGVEYDDLSPLIRREEISVEPDSEGRVSFEISYNCTGMESMMYYISQQEAISQVKNFRFVLRTDFKDIDFPAEMMSPTEKIEEDGGYFLKWSLDNSVTGKDIGLIIPNKLNPGEIVTRVTFFAPVPLLFFFAVLLVAATLLNTDLHPMHFAFLAATFFSFHLMYSYFSDHMNLYLTFGISSAVSLLLTITYLRLFAPRLIAYVLAPVIQFVYLVVFSFSFFFDGTTGVIVTVCSVVTLFILMQITGRLDWNEVFDKGLRKTERRQ